MKKTMYECDGCGMNTEYPHDFKMKEFYIGTDMGIPFFTTRRAKIHLCDGCFKSLKEISKAKKEK